MLDELFMHVLDMTKTASVVILAVMLARLLLKRAPKVFSYGLWALVLFRLLCPVSIALPVSVVPEMEPVSESYSLADEPISFIDAGSAAYHAVGDALNGGLGVQHVYTTEQDASGMNVIVTTDWWDIWILFGQYVWVAGIAVMLLYSGVSYLRLQKKLAIAVPLRDNIYIADNIASPFVIGLFRPRIYLPCTLSEKEQGYIILHEQYHIRRLDHAVKALSFLALTLHWFNPLVWAAFVLACKDMEMSCDEAVVRKMGEEIRSDYAQSLLSLATGRRIISGTPLAFGEGETGDRIKNLANWRKPGFWAMFAAVAACAVLAVCLLTNPVGKTTPYAITNSLQTQDVQWAQATVNRDETVHVMLSDGQIQELVELLNGLQEKDFRKTKGTDSYGSVMIKCADKEILLHFGGGQVGFVFDSKTAEQVDNVSWKVENEALNAALEEIYVSAERSGLSHSELERIKDKLSAYMVEYKIATLDANEITGMLDVVLYERVDGLEALIAQYLDLKYVKISMLEGELRLTGNQENNPGEVELIQISSGYQESGYRIEAHLPATDLSAVWETEQVKAHIERFQNMTPMERALSSQLADVAYIDADTWSECEQKIGSKVYNPLENASWLSHADSNGVSFYNGVDDIARYHVRITAHIPQNICIQAGYLDGDVRIALTATLQAGEGTYSNGGIWSRYVTFGSDTAQTGSGSPVLVIVPSATENYASVDAYWLQGNALYSVHLVDGQRRQDQLEKTLAKLLAEF